jgi:hypothetical protein
MHSCLFDPRERSPATFEPVFHNPAKMAALEQRSENFSDFLESGAVGIEPNRPSTQIEKKAQKRTTILLIARFALRSGKDSRTMYTKISWRHWTGNNVWRSKAESLQAATTSPVSKLRLTSSEKK